MSVIPFDPITHVFPEGYPTDLQESIQGQVILPGEPAYHEAKLAWNRSVEQNPSMIVVVKSKQDVSAAVKYARHFKLGVAVQATGHGNVRPADDCMLILTREMNGIEIDPNTQTASVEAGVKWGAVLEAAQVHGLTPLLGSSPTVGAVGYTLGGGLGWLGRKYGLSTDNVVLFEIVLSDGEIITASQHENSDLFWGLRGGGGSLGVIISMVIRLFPVTQVYAGNLYYPERMAKDVFRHYRTWIADAPDELTSSVLIMNYPLIPEIPEPLRGQSFAIVRGCYCGSIADGRELLNHWRAWNPPVIDDFKTIPFIQAASISNDPIDPLPGYNSAAWLRELTDPAIDTIVNYAIGIDGPSPLIFAEVRHAGGAIKRMAADWGVYGNREAELLLWLAGITPTNADNRNLITYTAKLKAELQSTLTGGVYMNAIEGSESRQRIRDGLISGGYERLSQLKAQVDPDNMFRYSFNIS